jgi:long-chain acyl-CoA synthetase
MAGDCAVAYARSPHTLREDLAATRPTALLAVPRLYERMLSAVQAAVANSFIRRMLLRATVHYGWKRFETVQGRDRFGVVERLLWRVLERVVARPILDAFGGRVRVAVSGGAPLDQESVRQLIGIGVPLLEGYGLTEAAPVVAANTLEDNLPGSVGFPLHGVEVTISEGGELLVRSPSMMSGYWNDEAETKTALDPAGWLATGDIAEIEQGRLFIRGRLKDTIVLTVGEKVNPDVVESELLRDQLFEQAIVIGNNRPHLVAMIVLNADRWRSFAAENDLNLDQPNHPASKLLILSRIDALLSGLPHHAQIRAVQLSQEPWTIDSGSLTPTLKVKRGAIAASFATVIDQLYTAAPLRRIP